MNTMIDRAPPAPPVLKLAGTTEESNMECEIADEIFKTARTMGSEYSFGLIRHAKLCQRSDWNHALPSEHHMLVLGDRNRQRGLEAWKQSEGATT